ncbi:unnamed protein product [Adineta ricciae]|uniref:Uncharacterized protein n=1 Tax=Adineta ricciae TaxID=249248 RepID=A0A815BJV6_ADIRI|nr:unnamed protein product [Adineta ricciae]
MLPIVLAIFTIVITVQQQSITRKQRAEDQKIGFEQVQLEKELADKQYQNDIFETYINDIGHFLIETNSTLAPTVTIASLIRAKTLNVLRHLETHRIARIIFFLYEANQLSTVHQHAALDLSTAELSHINFSQFAMHRKTLDQLSLTGVIFNNVTFTNVRMTNTNFSDTRFENVDFSHAVMDGSDFSFARLVNVTFSYATLRNVNFSYSEMENVQFVSTRLRVANFSFTSLSHISFSNSSMVEVTFSSAVLHHLTYSLANIRKADFSATQTTNLSFSSTILTATNFANANLSNTTFQRAQCIGAHFLQAILSSCDLSFANAKAAMFVRADLFDVNFTLTNLHKSDFMGSDATIDMLTQALTVHDARFSNGTLLHDVNLISDGRAKCHGSLTDHWTLESGNISIVRWNTHENHCYFALQPSNSTGVMIQNIVLSKIRNETAEKREKRLVLNGNVSVGVWIEVRGLTGEGRVVDEQVLHWNGTSVSLSLDDEMETVKVSVIFSGVIVGDDGNGGEMEKRWCDAVEAYMDYDNELEDWQIPLPNIAYNARWEGHGKTIAGGNESGSNTNQLSGPYGLCFDDLQHLYIADYNNHRVLMFRSNATHGQVVAGGRGRGNRFDQLNRPMDLLIDKETDTLIICDSHNRRVMQWPRINGKSGERIVDKIYCRGLALDAQRFLYVSDGIRNLVRQYRLGKLDGMIVAGGYGSGDKLNQLNSPTGIFIDRQQSIYISDSFNHRIVKWAKGAKEGIVVAGGHGNGTNLTQLNNPRQVIVDQNGTIYVADHGNQRIMRFEAGVAEGSVIVGDKGFGNSSDQFRYPTGLCFDGNGYKVYVLPIPKSEKPKLTLSVPEKPMPQVDNVENYVLVWLDQSNGGKGKSGEESKRQLQQVVNCVKIFLDPKTCHEFMSNVKDVKIFVIVSGAVEEDFVSSIHDEKQLESIYVYSPGKVQESWFSEYQEITGIYTTIHALCEQLSKDVTRLDRTLLGFEMMERSKSKNGSDASQQEASFMYDQLFRDIVLSVTDEDMQDISQNDILSGHVYLLVYSRFIPLSHAEQSSSYS